MAFCHGSKTGGFYLELAKQALDAATAIDNHRLGLATTEQYQSVKDLAQTLYRISEGYDPTSEMMMGNVFWPNKEDLKGKTVEDAKLQTRRFANDLETLTELLGERQEELRDASLSLSKAAQRYSRPLILKHSLVA